MEEQLNLSSDSIESKKLLSTNKFILLSLLTFNLYILWWTYKSWRLFQERESSDINSAARAIFSIFFLYSLFERVKRLAVLNGYEKSYSSGLLFTGVLVLGFSSYLPEPLLFVAFLSFACYVPVVEALNFAIEESGDYDSEEQRGFNTRQSILIVIGGLLWGLLLLGLFLPAEGML